jgi:hypothetical protein
MAISCGGTATPSRAATSTLSPPGLAPFAWCLSNMGESESVGFSGLSGQVVGSGHNAVILTNGSDDNPCAWNRLLPLLKQLNNTEVLIYLHHRQLPASIGAAVQFMRERGATHVLLIGQSVGGRETLLEASQLKPPPDAVISLSGESTADEVRHLMVPVLILASENDHYFRGADAREVFAAIPEADKQLKVFPGNLHGADLFNGPMADQALGGVIDFIRSHMS